MSFSRVQRARTGVVDPRHPALPRRASAHPAGGRIAMVRPKWPSPALALLAIVLALLGIGLIMVLSASIGLRAGQPWHPFAQQLKWAGLGAIALFAGAHFDYRRLQRHVPLLYWGAVLMLLAVLSPLGVSRNGSRRWIGAGGLQMQPSEIAKLALAFTIAALLSSRSGSLHDARIILRPAVAATVLIGALVMKEPDMGTAMIIVMIAATLFVASGMPGRFLMKCAGGLVIAVIVFALSADYRRHRILTFLSPSHDVSGTGYHLRQSLVGLGSGRLLGVGIGNGRAKLGYLPNASTDFIMSVIGEELGLIGALLVIGLFTALAVFGLRIARRAPDDFGYLLATGLTSWILIQAVLNIGAVCGMLPITGVPLPLISAGGSSLIVLLGAIGILLSIARRGEDLDRRAELVEILDESPLGHAVRTGVRHHPSTRTEPARSARPANRRGSQRHQRPASPSVPASRAPRKPPTR